MKPTTEAFDSGGGVAEVIYTLGSEAQDELLLLAKPPLKHSVTEGLPTITQQVMHVEEARESKRTDGDDGLGDLQNRGQINMPAMNHHRRMAKQGRCPIQG